MTYLNNIHDFKERRKNLRNNATLQERKLWYKIKNSQLGFKFRRQHSIGFYIVDFYCPSKKLIIEIDGPQHETNAGKEYDQIRTEYLLKLGLKEIRFTNIQIDSGISEVIQEILAVLNMD